MKSIKAFPIIILSVLAAALGALNIWQYYNSQELKENVIELNETISTQESTITSKDKTLSDLQSKAENYQEILRSLKSGNIGYASDNFKVDESVVVVQKNQKDKKVTLTANWMNVGEVSYSYHPYNLSERSANVLFADREWTTSTTLTIHPIRVGVTTVTFSNNVDSNTFKMIIIVTD